MKVYIRIEKEVEVKKLIVNADVRHWEDATINGKEDVDGTLLPCRKGSNWCPVIVLETGTIENWPVGTVADIHFKVCDAGIYQLIDSEGNIVKEIDGYVPDIMCPEGEGYGDYIIMKIDANGKIDKWKIVLREFQEDE